MILIPLKLRASNFSNALLFRRNVRLKSLQVPLRLFKIIFSGWLNKNIVQTVHYVCIIDIGYYGYLISSRFGADHHFATISISPRCLTINITRLRRFGNTSTGNESG